jgi:hypothetical protein
MPLKETNQINMSKFDERLPKNATDKVWWSSINDAYDLRCQFYALKLQTGVK